MKQWLLSQADCQRAHSNAELGGAGQRHRHGEDGQQPGAGVPQGAVQASQAAPTSAADVPEREGHPGDPHQGDTTVGVGVSAPVQVRALELFVRTVPTEHPGEG